VWAGKWAHEKKRYALAIRMLAPILAEANATPEMAYRLGDAYQNLGNTAAAKRCYQRAAVLNPKRDLFRIVAMTQLAALYEGAQEFRAALDAYREIVKAAANKQLLEAARQRILLLEKYLK
jgi:tetratricopeptide (TPR) repeat protein